MGQAVLPGDPPIEIVLRRSGRARRISLRVSRLDGRVTLSMPHWTPEAEALGFAREKEGWIRQNLAGRTGPQRPRMGEAIPVAGRAVTITPGTVRAARLDGDRLIVPPGDEMLGPRVAAFLKLRAKTALTEASARHAATLGVGYGRITLRDTRSRWGSCSAEGNLMYSWRLAMAPPEVLDYVAAHEVAHLVEMNHSPAFWRVVARLFPQHRPARAWLRSDGHALHGWQFKE